MLVSATACLRDDCHSWERAERAQIDRSFEILDEHLDPLAERRDQGLGAHERPLTIDDGSLECSKPATASASSAAAPDGTRRFGTFGFT